MLVSFTGESAIDSDNTPSPAASGSSDPQDSEMSSIETSPPPQLDDAAFSPSVRPYDDAKRFSTNSSAYSHSYQSSVFSDSHNSHPYLQRYTSNDGRPTTSGTSVNGGDEHEHADLTAAVGLLSCSYGTPKLGALLEADSDIPPVPRVPARFMEGHADHLSGVALSYNPPQSYSYLRATREADVDAEMSDEELDRNRRARSDEDDEGMFGKMEE